MVLIVDYLGIADNLGKLLGLDGRDQEGHFGSYRVDEALPGAVEKHEYFKGMFRRIQRYTIILIAADMQRDFLPDDE